MADRNGYDLSNRDLALVARTLSILEEWHRVPL